MVRVDIISRDDIKPSSPTPPSLRSFKLSLLDQLIPAPYTLITLFYPNQDAAIDLDVRLDELKDSLSKTLTRFYPLAGTIKDDLCIDCDDVGAYVAVARVDTRLDEFLKDPDTELINRFLPCLDPGSRVTNIQVNVFECRGIAISLCISHKIIDAKAMSTFLKGWAGTTRGSEEVVSPDLSAPSLFPANDLWLKDSSMVMWGPLLKFGKRCCTRRFVFDSSKLAALKAEAAGKGMKDPTRVEVVTALLWKCAMAASEEKVGSPKPWVLSHAVNLRRRSTPTSPENSIGNLIWLASAEWRSTKSSEISLSDLAGKVRGGVSEIDSDFVKKVGECKGREAMEESLKRLKDCGTNEGMNYIGFSSWCKMGYYEVDFGWGKPRWVCGSVCDGSPVFMDFVMLLDTRNGEGIEAWVNMGEEEMQILQQNQELLSFSSFQPSPLCTNQ